MSVQHPVPPEFDWLGKTQFIHPAEVQGVPFRPAWTTLTFQLRADTIGVTHFRLLALQEQGQLRRGDARAAQQKSL